MPRSRMSRKDRKSTYLEYVEYCQDLECLEKIENLSGICWISPRSFYKEKIENAMVATFVGACIRCTLGIQSGWHQP